MSAVQRFGKPVVGIHRAPEDPELEDVPAWMRKVSITGTCKIFQ